MFSILRSIPSLRPPLHQFYAHSTFFSPCSSYTNFAHLLQVFFYWNVHNLTNWHWGIYTVYGAVREWVKGCIDVFAYLGFKILMKGSRGRMMVRGREGGRERERERLREREREMRNRQAVCMMLTLHCSGEQKIITNRYPSSVISLLLWETEFVPGCGK